jgi:hypothetical protein
MGTPVPLAQLALAASLAIVSTAPLALTADPDGDWSGTAKCTGPSTDSPKGTSSADAKVTISGNQMAVYALVQPYLMYTVAYIPDAGNPANKGTLGYFGPGELYGWHETGQAKIERTKDGKVSFDGKSYALITFPGFAASGACEWKLVKISDTPSALPGAPI